MKSTASIASMLRCNYAVVTSPPQCLHTRASRSTRPPHFGHSMWVGKIGCRAWGERLAMTIRKMPARGGLIRQASIVQPNPLRPRLAAKAPTTTASTIQKRINGNIARC